MARKVKKLTPAQRDEVRRLAKAEAIRIVTEGSRFGASPFLLNPITRPFAAPISRSIPIAANALLKSGALDGFINAKINELAMQRGYNIQDVENKSRQELMFDLAEAGVDLLSDPELQKELDNLDRALQDEGTSLPGREVIRRSGQFSRQNLLPRTRKKTKTDKNMSKALAQANSELRTKAGKLRKGKTQADVMRRAHKIRKKMR